MNAAEQTTAGSHLWQMVFVSFAGVLVLFEMLRGWRSGLPRQIVRLIAIAAAYACAIFGGRMLLPLVRPMLRLPDVALTVVAGAVMAAIVYVMINGIGRLLFRPTAAREAGVIRVAYGAGGAFFGMMFGAFFVWLLLIGIRSLGSLAEVQARSITAPPSAVPPNAKRIVDGRLVSAEATPAPDSLAQLLARLKNSVELGAVGETLRRTDPLPTESLDLLSKLAEVLSRADSSERFLSFPGARELTRHPRIVELQQDPEIARLAREGRFLELLQNQRVIDALNDPTLIDRIKHFDLRGAVQFASRSQQ